MIQPTRLFAICFLSALALALAALPAIAETVDFDDLTLPPDSSSSGPFANAGPSFTENDGFSSGQLSSFSSGSPAPVQFANNYDTTYMLSSGFAYSNLNNTAEGDPSNQYAAYTGVGAGPGVGGAADNYAVGFGYLDQQANAFTGQTFAFDPTKPTAQSAATLAAWLPQSALPSGYQINSLQVTNTTYTALTLLNGGNGATAFGPNSYYEFWVYGSNAQGQVLPTYADFYLAQGTNIVNTWSTIDDLASKLSGATTLYFEVTSSDNGAFGMNTPGYFALDNLVIQPVPEPSSLAILAAGACGLFVVARRRRGAQRRRPEPGIMVSSSPAIPHGASILP